MPYYAQANRDIWPCQVDEPKTSRLTPAVICDEGCVVSADTQHRAGRWLVGRLEPEDETASVSAFQFDLPCAHMSFNVHGESLSH